MAAPNLKPVLPRPPQREDAIGAPKRAAAKRKIKIIHHHHDDGEGNWLVSYADMMTLLFGFFVMLSAFSIPDPSKLESVKKQTSEALGGKYTKPFEQISNSVKQTLSDIKLDKEVSVAETDDGVTIISKGTLFFDSGSATLKPDAALLMNKIAATLAQQAKGFRVTVEGHTDDSPINTKEFPSNWELSSIRAGVVVRLLEDKGLPRKDLRPVGLADTEPVSPNRDAQGSPIPANQAENRRIVIRIQKQLPLRMPAKAAPANALPTGGLPFGVPAQAPSAMAPALPGSQAQLPTGGAPIGAPGSPAAVSAGAPKAAPAAAPTK